LQLFHGGNTGSNPVGDAKFLVKINGLHRFGSIVQADQFLGQAEDRQLCETALRKPHARTRHAAQQDSANGAFYPPSIAIAASGVSGVSSPS
jgi:hypothetical protein